MPLILLGTGTAVVLGLLVAALAVPSARERAGNGVLLALLAVLGGLVVVGTLGRLGIGARALSVVTLAGFAAVPPLAALYARRVLQPDRPLSRADLVYAAPPAVALVVLAVVGALRPAGASLLVGAGWWAYVVGLQAVGVGFGVVAWRAWRAGDRSPEAGRVLAVFAAHWALSAASWLAVGAGAGGAAAVLEAGSLVALLAFGGLAAVLGLRALPALRPAPPAPYASDALGEAERTRLADRLRRLVDEDRPHLDPDLTAATLAEQLGATPRELSQVLTLEFSSGFYEFVNGLRVEAAKRRLADPDCGDETVLSILYASGFNAKSTFHRAFREHVGQTPSAYRREALMRHRTAA